MVVGVSLRLPHELGLAKSYGRANRFKGKEVKSRGCRPIVFLSLHSSRQDVWSLQLRDKIYKPAHCSSYRCNVFVCRASSIPSSSNVIPLLKKTNLALTRLCNAVQGSPTVLQLVPAVGIIAFALWGLGPLIRQSRSLFLHKSDSTWKRSRTYYIFTSYLQPLLLWTGATLICRVLDPVVLPSQASQAVKQRLLNFVRSLSTVLAFAYCLSGLIQQTQKFFMEKNDSDGARNMGFEFAGKAVYTAVWVAAFSLFMELLGFSTQKWITAGGLGTVLLTLAGREIFTNFLSSVMIHATQPFVVNEWIQTKIEGYEVSGTVERVGWWSPTIIRGDDREAIHIPNHKFTVSVVRNLSQKTHWRIKTHLAISHLDANKIHNIVADMRKVLSKNPQVEQQRLHRRVFLDNVNPENQALLILVSCFVKTSHFEEYLCVKEAVLLDLLRVISHHRARLATPIRTVQKIYGDANLENIPFAETIFSRAGTAVDRPYLLVEPLPRINGEDKSKPHSTSRGNEEQTITVPGGAVQNTVDKRQQQHKANSGDDRAKSSKVHPPVAAAPSPKTPSKSQLDGLDSVGSGSKASVKKPPFSEAVGDQADGVPPPTTKARPAFEDNIVLGVALEGSKRTLPIEEGMGPVGNHMEVNKVAAARKGNGIPHLEDKDSKPGASPGDQRDQDR